MEEETGNPRRAIISRQDLNSSQDEDIQLLDEDSIEDDSFDDNDAYGGYDGVPEVGMVFKTQQEVTSLYKRYARRVGFGVTILRSTFNKEGHCSYLELMCSKGERKRPEPLFRKRARSTTNCQAKIRVRLWADGLLHLELVSLDHNHPVSPSMALILNSPKHLTGFARQKALRENTENLGGQPEEPPQMAHISRLAALEELLFGETECRSFAHRGRLTFVEGDAEALRLFFTRMQAKNSNFFNVVDLDEQGCARSVFWSDSRSRAAYEYYNDVVTLDITYIENKYELPLALFLGVNHHGQPVLLGCALLSDQTAETYAWLLKAWIACMAGFTPKALITDYYKVIEIAVAEVLPGVRHRFCLFQIMKKVSESFAGLAEFRAMYKQMQKAVYDSLTVDEFDEEWRNLMEMYLPEGNDWLRSLYDRRHSWVPVYLKDTFWAGMSTTQRNESISAFFDGYVDVKTTIKQFISKYELALQSKYDKEAQADFQTFHKRQPPISKFYMEEQLSKVYTINIFKKFQDEIKAMMYCQASVVHADESISTFNVKECTFLEDGRAMTKNHGVLYNAEKNDVQCICGSFEFRGILCRHALSVFKLQQVREIPTQYVLDRWKMDYKRLHVMSRPTEDVVANNRVDRYDYLSMRCLQLVEIGVFSDKYQLALKLVRESEKFLLSENTHYDTSPKIVPYVKNKSNKPDKDELSVGEIKESQARELQVVDLENGDEERPRRGRPSKAKESQAKEPQPVAENANEGQRRGRPSHAKESHVPQGMTTVGNQTYLHVVPTMPYMQPNLGPHPSIKQKDGANPNALPIGSQFGVQMDPQQHMGNQTGIRPNVVFMFPSALDPQSMGNGPMMPWVYPQMYQAQQVKDSPAAAAGQPVRKKTASRRKKTGQLGETLKEPPASEPSSSTPPGSAPSSSMPPGSAPSSSTPPGSAPSSSTPPGSAPSGFTPAPTSSGQTPSSPTPTDPVAGNEALASG